MLRARELWQWLSKAGQGVATPCYVYDLSAVERNAASFIELARGRAEVLYATMANPRPEVLSAVRRAGVGAFVNSAAHLGRVIEAGIAPDRVMFAGAGHGDNLLAAVARSGCMYVADSVDQLSAYASHGPKGAFGVRVNVGSLLGLPADADPAPRLGLTVEEVRKAASVCPISILHVYVGTNLETPERHVAAIEGLGALARELDGVDTIDLGGGFARSPADAGKNHGWEAVLDAWERVNGKRELRLVIEPGRSIVRTAGCFFVGVTDVKRRGDRRYVVVDSSASWYPRKLVHDADDHQVGLASREGEAGGSDALICGASTFSQDILAEASLPEVEPGDVLAFEASGAYCEAMHLDFLGMPAPTVWVIEDGRLRRVGAGGCQA